MATDTTAVADIEVVGSALGAYPGGEIVGILRPPTGDGDGPDDDAPLSHLRNAWVLVPRLLPCGECEPCRRGRVSVCPALSRRPARPQPIETVPARFVLPLTPRETPQSTSTVTRAQIERQLGEAITLTPIASSFSEIERALV